MNGGCPELNPPEIPQTSITAAKGKLIYSKQTKMKTGWLKPAGSQLSRLIPIAYCNIYIIVISFYLFTHTYIHTYINLNTYINININCESSSFPSMSIHDTSSFSSRVPEKPHCRVLQAVGSSCPFCKDVRWVGNTPWSHTFLAWLCSALA